MTLLEGNFSISGISRHGATLGSESASERDGVKSLTRPLRLQGPKITIWINDKESCLN